MSRVSKEQAAKNRETVVHAASTLLRQKGLDGVGVRELMASACLTHGAFAKQFGSKEQLAAEACALAFQGAEEALGALSREDITQVAGYYLSRKPPEMDCPMATLAMDAARSSKGSAFREEYSNGLGRLAALIAGDPASPGRLTLFAAMVGASLLQRATDDQSLADNIKEAVVGFSHSVI